MSEEKNGANGKRTPIFVIASFIVAMLSMGIGGITLYHRVDSQQQKERTEVAKQLATTKQHLTKLDTEIFQLKSSDSSNSEATSRLRDRLELYATKEDVAKRTGNLSTTLKTDMMDLNYQNHQTNTRLSNLEGQWRMFLINLYHQSPHIAENMSAPPRQLFFYNPDMYK